jgi:glucan 1,3-beta-glucosidase
MVTQNGNSLAKYSDNVDVFPDDIALFQLASAGGGPTTASSPPTTLSTKTSTSSSPPTSSGWVFLGCYTDSVSARTLSQHPAVAGGASATTIEACQAVCHSLGYSLAGVEYTDECCKRNALPSPPSEITNHQQTATTRSATAVGPPQTEMRDVIWPAPATAPRSAADPTGWTCTAMEETPPHPLLLSRPARRRLRHRRQRALGRRNGISWAAIRIVSWRGL